MDKKGARQKVVKFRKNAWATFIITLFLWGAISFLVYFTDPHDPFIAPLFFIFVFLALLFSFSIIFVNTKRGLIASLLLSLFIIFRYFGIGNLLNLVLLIGVGIALDKIL